MILLKRGGMGLSHIPLLMLHCIGWCLGWLIFLSSASYRKRFFSFSKQAGYSFNQVRAAVGSAGKLLVELPRVWFYGEAIPHQIVGQAYIDKALIQKKGLILLTPHGGSFEVGPPVFANYFANKVPLTVLYRPPRRAWLQNLVKRARTYQGIQVVPTDMSGVKALTRALQAKQAIGLLPDQVPPKGLGSWASFFGRPAYTMTLAARLALRTQAPVMMVWVRRLDWGRGYKVHFHPLEQFLMQPLSNQLDQAVVQINQAIESVIRYFPDQYLWGYNRYKQPRDFATLTPVKEPLQNSNMKKRLENGIMQSFEW
jgi:KDO2-lipid IV(A) lauroyltransferase